MTTGAEVSAPVVTPPSRCVKPIIAFAVDTRPAQAHNRGMSRRTLRGWAVWGASLAVVLLLNGIVWTLVIAG